MAVNRSTEPPALALLRIHRRCRLNNAHGGLVSLYTRRKCDIIAAYFLLCNMNLIGHFSLQHGY